MKLNTAKQKMLEGKPAFGFGMGLGSPAVAETLSRTGIDFLLLDRQHGSWGDDSTIAALTAMAAGSTIPMARVARNDYTLIGRLLDEGMLGIVVPMVHTPAGQVHSTVPVFRSMATTASVSGDSGGVTASPVPT